MDQINLDGISDVIVLDDDPSIFEIWKNKLPKSVALKYFENERQLGCFLKGREIQDLLFLVDHDLGADSLNGLEVIEKFGLIEKSILVTSRFEEDAVIQKAKKLKIKLIPKSSAELVPVSNGDELPYFDLIILDDSSVLLSAFQARAKEAQKTIRCFSEPSSFVEFLCLADKHSPLIIDQNLGHKQMSGTEVAFIARKMGFEHVRLTSGQNPATSELEQLKASGITFVLKASDEYCSLTI